MLQIMNHLPPTTSFCQHPPKPSWSTKYLSKDICGNRVGVNTHLLSHTHKWLKCLKERKGRKAKWSSQKTINTPWLHPKSPPINSFTILYIVWIHTLITEKLWNGHKKRFYHRGFHLHVNVRLNEMFLVIKISSKLEIQPIKGLFSDNIA